MIHPFSLAGVRIVNANGSADGKEYIRVYTDYNPDFVKHARKLNGSWHGDGKYWLFDRRDIDRVKSILIDVYGDDGETKAKTVNVYVFLDKIGFEQSLFMFGRQILHTWGRDSKIIMGEGVIVDQGWVRSGGSRKNPCITHEEGTVLIVRDVPENKLKSEPETAYKIIDSGTPNNDEQAKAKAKAKAKIKIKMLALKLKHTNNK